MIAALACVLMLVADRAGGYQLTGKERLNGGTGVPLCADDDLNPTLVEDVHSAAAHTTGDHHLCAVIRQKIGQEAGTVTGVGNALLRILPSCVSKKMKFSQWPK